MLVQAPSLADQLASLRAATAADEGRAWLPAALQAMIMAVLARLLGRLEQLIQLWQSGQLPPLPTRAPRRHLAAAYRRPATPHPATRHRLAAPRTRLRACRRVIAPQATARPIRARRTPDDAARRAASATAHPFERPRPGRDPPPALRPASNRRHFMPPRRGRTHVPL